jgi:hypothetical protein
MLGQMLFDGDRLAPQRARGLMLLTLACENAGPDETWIKESYNRAMASASESDRAMALQMLQEWVKDNLNWRSRRERSFPSDPPGPRGMSAQNLRGSLIHVQRTQTCALTVPSACGSSD